MNVCPKLSAATFASRVSPSSPASRSADTQPRGVRSASPPTTRIHGSPVLTADATVADAGSTGPADSDSPSVRKNDSRLMPRSNPTNPAT